MALLALSAGGYAQHASSSAGLQLLGTRSWIRLNWKPVPGGNKCYRVYWSSTNKRPAQPNIVLKEDQTQYYIQDLLPETEYHVWVEAAGSAAGSNLIEGHALTSKQWKLEASELEELRTNPSSTAVPQGMQLFWQDEFNDTLLNRNKWSTNYYSSLNNFSAEAKKEMLAGSLPQPAYRLNGKTIDLFVNDSLPLRLYNKNGNQKISSIQTYDWRTNENLLDNSRGGYFEVKVKRSSKGNPRGLNTTFWFDSPGPDLRYYLEQGSTVDGVEGIRPAGQLFEIDVFEYLNAQFVLHGQVDKNGKFIHNLATHIANGYQHADNWVTHGVLWTPTSIKHYINGQLIGAYTDKYHIFSPNHFMNLFLGSYGSGGNVTMEVDYIRAYQWPLENGNELPDPGFENSDSLGPWEGNGILLAGAGVQQSRGLQLKPGGVLEQYVYLDNDAPYHLNFYVKGKGTVKAIIENVTQVTGVLDKIREFAYDGRRHFSKKRLGFTTGREYGHNKKTVRLSFVNQGQEAVILDNITLKK